MRLHPSSSASIGKHDILGGQTSQNGKLSIVGQGAHWLAVAGQSQTRCGAGSTRISVFDWHFFQVSAWAEPTRASKITALMLLPPS